MLRAPLQGSYLQNQLKGAMTREFSRFIFQVFDMRKITMVISKEYNCFIKVLLLEWSRFPRMIENKAITILLIEDHDSDNHTV